MVFESVKDVPPAWTYGNETPDSELPKGNVIFEKLLRQEADDKFVLVAVVEQVARAIARSVQEAYKRFVQFVIAVVEWVARAITRSVTWLRTKLFSAVRRDRASEFLSEDPVNKRLLLLSSQV